MKYLKSINELNNSISEYYEEISKKEYVDERDERDVKFTDIEINTILRRYNIDLPYDGIYNTDHSIKFIHISAQLEIENDKYLIFINKCEDEYFYVGVNRTFFYKCDQFDGLLQLIDDKKLL